MRLLWVLGLVWFLAGCQSTPYMKEESLFIVMKTPTMRYADQGFIYTGKDRVKVEIYANAQPLLRLEILPQKICMSSWECVTKRRFNQEVLSGAYPEDILEKVFLSQPIMDGANIQKKRNGFTQHLIKSGKYDIEYTVLNNQTQFRDTINHILIKIQRL